MRAVIILALAAMGTGASTTDQPRGLTPTRIVSVVPAVTEMLFAIGAGSAMAAVSSFDDYPDQVQALPRVGALLDPDVERILSLKPDLVVLYATQTDLQQQLQRAGIPVFTFRTAGVREIADAMRQLGVITGHLEQATRAADTLSSRLEAIRQRVANRPRPRTLLVFSHEPGTLRSIYASGGYGFLDDMLRLAGGTNVFEDFARESVQCSTESILAAAPEVIIDLQYGSTLQHVDPAQVEHVWSVLRAVPAVRHHRVHVLVGNDLVIPGPRVAEATERLARALHPDAF